MERLTVKTSTIFVSVGDETRVYRSMGEVPAGLRRKLEKSTTGMNAATILIADKRGREEIVRAVRGLPTGLQDRVPDIARAQARLRVSNLQLERAARTGPARRYWPPRLARFYGPIDAPPGA